MYRNFGQTALKSTTYQLYTCTNKENIVVPYVATGQLYKMSQNYIICMVIDKSYKPLFHEKVHIILYFNLTSQISVIMSLVSS